MRFRIARFIKRKSLLAQPARRLVFLLMVTALRGVADDKLDVQPGTIAVSPAYSSIKALVILQTDKPVKDPTLSWMSNDVPSVEIVRLPSAKGAPGRVTVWSAKIDFLPRVRVPGAVLFHAEYSSDGIPRHAFHELALSSQADGTGKAIEASIEGNFDAISEQRPGFAHLVVTNNLDVPVSLHVDVQVPPDVFEKPIPDEFEVPARSSVQEPVTLKVRHKTTPGAYSIVFSLSATWQRAGYEERREVVVSKLATAGVFFESELLKVLGIPSFLVLPGCLVLFTMQLMLTLGIFGLKNDSRLPQLTLTSPGFWILAISFSGIFAFAYISIPHTNYLLRYGAEDLRNVWLWSIVVGIAVYCLYALVTLRSRLKHVPTADDDPIKVLQKMHNNGINFDTSRIKFKIGSAEFTGHVIEKIKDEMPLIWVAPKISVVWEDTDAARAQEEVFTDARDRQPPASFAELAELLQRAHDDGNATVRWSTSKSGVPHPYHLKVEAITDYIAPEQIFEIA
jgi:hypothetical protein